MDKARRSQPSRPSGSSSRAPLPPQSHDAANKSKPKPKPYNRSIPGRQHGKASQSKLKKADDSLSFAKKDEAETAESSGPLVPTNEALAEQLAGLPNLHKLDFTNAGLTKGLDFLPSAKGLTWLNLSGNVGLAKDESLWGGLEALSNLMVLNASSCSLTFFPPQLASLTSLKALVLSHNALTSLPNPFPQLDLNTLIVSYNSLTSLPPLSHLTSLTKINFSHNSLTASSLPDLSTLSKLREVRLNDNPLLELPEHFAAWGGRNDPGPEGRKGLEIVELGHCGFKDWSALRYLAGQERVVNLGLKGNGVVVEAIEEEGFEAFKAKMTILLPHLRILDATRFDAKYAELKAKREARAPEQKILDAGPMAFKANEELKKSGGEFVRIKALEKSRGRKRRREKGGEEEGEESGDENEGEKEVEAGEEGSSAVTKVTGADKQSKKDRSGDDSAPSKKKKKRTAENDRDMTAAEAEAAATSAAEPAASTTTSAEDAKAERKAAKRKNRHEARREAETGDAARPKAPVVEKVEEVPEPKKKKRGRESKFLGTTRTEEEREESKKAKQKKKGVDSLPPAPAVKEKREKREKRTGGLLDALRGDGTEPEERPLVLPVASEELKPAEEKKEKVKTSVLKVVEVKKKKPQETEASSSVFDLLGATKSADPLGELGGWD